MTVTMHEPSTTGSARNGIAARLLVPGFWGAVSIVAMWLAVLFDGVFGGDMVSPTSPTRLAARPSSGLWCRWPCSPAWRRFLSPAVPSVAEMPTDSRSHP